MKLFHIQRKFPTCGVFSHVAYSSHTQRHLFKSSALFPTYNVFHSHVVLLFLCSLLFHQMQHNIFHMQPILIHMRRTIFHTPSIHMQCSARMQHLLLRYSRFCSHEAHFKHVVPSIYMQRRQFTYSLLFLRVADFFPSSDKNSIWIYQIQEILHTKSNISSLLK